MSSLILRSHPTVFKKLAITSTFLCLFDKKCVKCQRVVAIMRF